MALGLTFREQDDFYVDDTRFVVMDILSPTACIVQREDTGARFHIVDSRSTEIYPEVRLSIGTDGQNTLARLSFEAPRSVIILTGRNYQPA